MNLPTVIVLAAVVLPAGLAVFYLIKNRKKGKSCCDGCGGDCMGCNINNK